jgi:hypothetical protein
LSSFVPAKAFRFPPARPKRAKPHRMSAAKKFKGLAQKSAWREEADRAIECLLDRLDTLAADLVMKQVQREFDLTFDQWIQLLGLIGHALFPEVYTRPGEEPSHEGLLPRKAGRDAFPLTPRRLSILVAFMRSWDKGEELGGEQVA